jgi:hypothetical protein
MRYLKEIWSSTMEERESGEHEILFPTKVSLGEEEVHLNRHLVSNHYRPFWSLRSGPEWFWLLLRTSSEQLWMMLRSRAEAS